MSSTSQSKANAFWKDAGGPRTFATQFEPLEQDNSYSAKVKVGRGKVRTLNVTERINMGTMIVVPREITQVWEEMGVDYKKQNGNIPSRPDGSRWCVYLEGQASIWAQHIADAVALLEPSE